MEDEGDTNYNWNTWNSPQEFLKGAGRVKNQDHPNYSIEISQNTEKSPGDLRRFAVTQTPVRHPLHTLRI